MLYQALVRLFGSSGVPPTNKADTRRCTIAPTYSAKAVWMPNGARTSASDDEAALERNRADANAGGGGLVLVRVR